jgi:hypothetical protein
MLYRVHLACAVFELTTLVVIDTDRIGNYKSNYHMLTTTTVPGAIQVKCLADLMVSVLASRARSRIGTAQNLSVLVVVTSPLFTHYSRVTVKTDPLGVTIMCQPVNVFFVR